MQIRKKNANRVGKVLIAESGADWCPKKHTKNPTIFTCCFFLMGVLAPKKVFYKYLAEFSYNNFFEKSNIFGENGGKNVGRT